MVRFICLEILTTGDFAFECAFSVRWSSLDQRTCLIALFALKRSFVLCLKTAYYMQIDELPISLLHLFKR